MAVGGRAEHDLIGGEEEEEEEEADGQPPRAGMEWIAPRAATDGSVRYDTTITVG